MNQVALVIGAGDATGGAIARRFAREGYTACVTRRGLDKLQPLLEQIRAGGGKAQGFASDARKEEDVVALVEQIEATVGPIEALVFNIGANVPSSILDETARKWWRVKAAPRARSSSPAPPRRCGAPPTSPRSRAPSMRCGHWRRGWHANSPREVPAPAAARRLDPRARSAAVEREVLIPCGTDQELRSNFARSPTLQASSSLWDGSRIA